MQDNQETSVSKTPSNKGKGKGTSIPRNVQSSSAALSIPNSKARSTVAISQSHPTSSMVPVPYSSAVSACSNGTVYIDPNEVSISSYANDEYRSSSHSDGELEQIHNEEPNQSNAHEDSIYRAKDNALAAVIEAIKCATPRQDYLSFIRLLVESEYKYIPPLDGGSPEITLEELQRVEKDFQRDNADLFARRAELWIKYLGTTLVTLTIKHLCYRLKLLLAAFYNNAWAELVDEDDDTILKRELITYDETQNGLRTYYLRNRFHHEEDYLFKDLGTTREEVAQIALEHSGDEQIRCAMVKVFVRTLQEMSAENNFLAPQEQEEWSKLSAAYESAKKEYEDFASALGVKSENFSRAVLQLEQSEHPEVDKFKELRKQQNELLQRQEQFCQGEAVYRQYYEAMKTNPKISLDSSTLQQYVERRQIPVITWHVVRGSARIAKLFETPARDGIAPIHILNGRRRNKSHINVMYPLATEVGATSVAQGSSQQGKPIEIIATKEMLAFALWSAISIARKKLVGRGLNEKLPIFSEREIAKPEMFDRFHQYFPKDYSEFLCHSHLSVIDKMTGNGHIAEISEKAEIPASLAYGKYQEFDKKFEALKETAIQNYRKQRALLHDAARSTHRQRVVDYIDEHHLVLDDIGRPSLMNLPLCYHRFVLDAEQPIMTQENVYDKLVEWAGTVPFKAVDSALNSNFALLAAQYSVDGVGSLYNYFVRDPDLQVAQNLMGYRAITWFNLIRQSDTLIEQIIPGVDNKQLRDIHILLVRLRRDLLDYLKDWDNRKTLQTSKSWYKRLKFWFSVGSQEQIFLGRKQEVLQFLKLIDNALTKPPEDFLQQLENFLDTSPAGMFSGSRFIKKVRSYVNLIKRRKSLEPLKTRTYSMSYSNLSTSLENQRLRHEITTLKEQKTNGDDVRKHPVYTETVDSYESRLVEKDNAMIALQNASSKTILVLKTDLANTRADLANTRAELTETRGKLAVTEGKVIATEGQLTETRTELTETRTELTETRDKLAVTEGKVIVTEGKVIATEGQLTETRTDLTETRTELTETRTELTATRTELTETKSELTDTRRVLDKTNETLIQNEANSSARILTLEANATETQAQIKDLLQQFMAFQRQQGAPEALLPSTSNSSDRITDTSKVTVSVPASSPAEQLGQVGHFAGNSREQYLDSLSKDNKKKASKTNVLR